jgi:phosphopantothenoylcysteine decarboxylase/phosphopantothenate--cysteine ligase
VCGSIASYKAAIVARLLIKAGVRVLPVMTKAASKMLGAATLAGITGEPVRSDMFEPTIAGELHVDLATRADLIAVVPATAEFLSALASGRADDLLRATVLCAQSTVLLAPAMHPRMWSHPATRRNVAVVRGDGAEFVGPVVGEVASGEIGEGRMAEPEAIAAAILAHLGKRDLAGRHLVVTAGPTIEDIDPARYLSNRSSGKMGYAVAVQAARRGAKVTLISGPVRLAPPVGVATVAVRSALEMREAIHATLADSPDALVMAAAVADYRPAQASLDKLKRTGPTTLELLPNPDLLAELGAERTGPRPLLVGFALETASGELLIEKARTKLEKKRVDLVVANSAPDAFDNDDNCIVLVTRDRALALPRASKLTLADQLLDTVLSMLP